MDNEDLFAAVLSGDFSKVEISDEDLLVALMDNGYISRTQEYPQMLTRTFVSATEMSFEVLVAFTTDHEYSVGDYFYIHLDGEWNNPLFAKFYDGAEDWFDDDDYKDWRIEQEIRDDRMKEEYKYIKKWVEDDR